MPRIIWKTLKTIKINLKNYNNNISEEIMRTSRRQFIKTGAVVSAAALISSPLNSMAGRSKEAASSPRLMVASGKSPAENTRKVIEALGGMEKFVKKGNKVLLKPNSIMDGGPELAVNTHYEVVGVVTELCIKAGASEVVAGMRDGKYASDGNGTTKAVEDAGGSMLCTTRPGDYQLVDVHRGLFLRSVNIMKKLVECDVFINLPVAKHHADSRLSIAIKNYMGLVPRNDAVSMHRMGLDQSMVDLATVRLPDLTIVDATRILLRNGPSGPGPTKKLDMVIGSTDMLAADAYAASLFDLSPRKVRHLYIAYEMGIGEVDPNKMVVHKFEV